MTIKGSICAEIDVISYLLLALQHRLLPPFINTINHFKILQNDFDFAAMTTILEIEIVGSLSVWFLDF